MNMKPKLTLRRPKAVVYLPAECQSADYAGPLYGYYVENTNQYNVTSTGGNDSRASLIGEIFPSEPTDRANALIGWRDADGQLAMFDRDGKKCKIEYYSLKLDVFSRNTGILESDIMLRSGAVLVGCGSVGSLIAVELAKAGVGRFLLIDNDILGYHNVCRHQCGTHDVGRYKTDAVADRIRDINPAAEVITCNAIIQEVSLGLLQQFCTPSTIIIGGADNREGDLYANRIAKEAGIAMMSVGFWERAFAGEIFYTLPGQPDYADFLWSIGGSSGRATQNRKFYTNEEDLEKTVFEPGISIDINFVTIIAVKLAVDILNRENDRYTPRLLGHLTQYTLVCNTNNPKIGGENAEIFAYPLQVTTSIEVPFAPKGTN